MIGHQPALSSYKRKGNLLSRLSVSFVSTSGTLPAQGTWMTYGMKSHVASFNFLLLSLSKNRHQWVQINCS